MRTRCLFLCLLLVICGTVQAQDIVTLRSGKVFNAKIISIEGDKIKYTDSKDPTKTELVVFCRDVYSIQYENGMTQVFEQTPKKEEKNASTSTTTKPEPRTNTLSEEDVLQNMVFRSSFAIHFSDVSTCIVQLEVGKRFSEIPVALTGGIAWGSASTENTESHSLRIPIGVDYMIGDTKGWNLDIYGGLAWNYLLKMTYNGVKYDLSRYDRTSWSGIFRIAAGHKDFFLFGQYDFSFQSGVGGMWSIGIGWQY